METLKAVAQDVVPYIFLILITMIIEFNIKYKHRNFLDIEDFYVRGIRILILIIIAIRLNSYGSIYTYISFVLTYIICVILDSRYRSKFEKMWEKGTIEINRYIKKHQKISMLKYIKIRFGILANNYSETYSILKFKIGASIIILTVLFIAFLLFSKF